MTAGDRRLVVGDLVVEVGRWWAPLPAPGRCASRLELRPVCPPRRPAGTGSCCGLLGLGPGLTPAGDDLLAGLLVGLSARPDLRDPLAGGGAGGTRPARTTWLQRRAARGWRPPGSPHPAVVAVADALAGHGADDALPHALPALLAVGHTSGAALARACRRPAATTARSHASGGMTGRGRDVLELRRGAYYDSVTLLQVSRDAAGRRRGAAPPRSRWAPSSTSTCCAAWASRAGRRRRQRPGRRVARRRRRRRRRALVALERR